jgi:prevent-host-death family protein
MVIIMTMKMVNVNEAKARLSDFLDAVANGERVVICRRNQPIAELRPVEQKRTERRTIGGSKGIVIPPSFFEPMPDDFLDAFENGPVYPDQEKGDAPRVAEKRAAYDRTPPARRRR